MGSVPYPNIAALAGDIARAPQQNYFAARQNQASLAAQGQEAQLRSGQITLQQQQIKDQQAMTQALHDWDGQNIDELPSLVIKRGASAGAVLGLKNSIIEQKTKLATLNKDQFAQQERVNDLVQGVHDQVTNAAPEQKQQVYSQGLQQLQAAGVDVSKEPPQYPGDDVFANHLPAIRLHSALLSDAAKQREMEKSQAETAKNTAQAAEANVKTQTEPWQVIPELGVRVNKATGETTPVSGAAMTPGMMESKYVQLAQAKAAGQPVSAQDVAFMRGYEKYKTLVPVANFNMQMGAGAGNAPLNPSQEATVQAIMDGRMAPPSSFALKTPYWQNIMGQVFQRDPGFSEQRAQLRKDFTVGKHSTEINAINTAMGHVGVMGDAIDALNNNDVNVLNRIANTLGVQVGKDNVTTFKTIVHRVGPEIAKAYLGAGGSAGERGADEKDFDPSLGPQQLKSNVSMTAKLLRSKISALENQWNQNAPAGQDFESRFIMPEAKQQLDKWAPQGGGGKQGGGAAHDPLSIR